MLYAEKRTWAEISLGNLENNYKMIRKLLPAGCGIAGICKANGYGHGGKQVAEKLQELGAEYIAVSCFDEAKEIRDYGITLPLLILAPSPAAIAKDIVEINAQQTIADIDFARRANRQLENSDRQLEYQIKLDTGMCRTGFRVDSEKILEEVTELLSLPNLTCKGIFTHFSVSEEPRNDFTAVQYKRFVEFVKKIEEAAGKKLGIKHCANSGAVLNFPETDADLVRAGILLYGHYPSSQHGDIGIKPVMQLKTRVCEINKCKAGDTISYGRKFSCPEEMTVATLPIGYADGLLRSLSGKLEVLINGQRARQIGAICMDMCMVDITNIENVKCGDIVTIFGEEIDIAETAEAAGTIPYELLCAVSQRVPRIYI